MISFASFPDETSLQADYILPDHTGLESWGYQKATGGADRVVISGSQPVVAPFYNTRATADVLLAAVQAIGGNLATALPYTDVVDYMENALVDLVTQEGFYNAAEIKTFMANVPAIRRLVECPAWSQVLRIGAHALNPTTLSCSSKLRWHG